MYLILESLQQAGAREQTTWVTCILHPVLRPCRSSACNLSVVWVLSKDSVTIFGSSRWLGFNCTQQEKTIETRSNVVQRIYTKEPGSGIHNMLNTLDHAPSALSICPCCSISCSRFLITFLPRNKFSLDSRSLLRWQLSDACPNGTSRAGAFSNFSNVDATGCMKHILLASHHSKGTRFL